MTGSAFIKRLAFRLDFLSDADKHTVIRFYEKKLSAASTLTDEEAIVASFGSPEHIVEKLRESFAPKQEPPVTENPAPKQKPPVSENQASESENADSSPSHTINRSLRFRRKPSANTKPVSESPAESDAEDLIFSKPPLVEKAPEIIHAIENPEIKPIFGEKVIIEEKPEPIEEIILDPVLPPSAPSLEEIELAKAETLEKAQKYNTASFGIKEITQPVLADEILKSKDDAPTGEAPESAEKAKIHLDQAEEAPDLDFFRQKDEYPGLFHVMFSNSSLSDNAQKKLTVFLSVLLSPILLLVFGAIVVLYAASAAVIVLLSALLFIIMAAFIIGGIIEIVYGVVLLFETVSVALIEIGVGTALFGIVCAVVAMIYEFLFAVVPRTLRRITALCKKYLAVLKAFIYGGEA